MDIYLTAKELGARLRIPLLPDSISITTGANMFTATVYNIGQVSYPRGLQATAWSWKGVFPAEYMSELGFVFDWQEPQRIIKLLEDWQENGYIVNLMITELSINEDVYIEKLTYEYSGVGNADYDISLKKARTLTVTTVSENDIPPKKGTPAKKYLYAIKAVKVRKQPSSKSTVIGNLKKYEKVEVLGTSGNWTHIVYESEKSDDGTGWVKSSYLKSKKTSDKLKKKERKKASTTPKRNVTGKQPTVTKKPIYEKPQTSKTPKKVPVHAIK